MIAETLTEELKSSGVNLISNCGVCLSLDHVSFVTSSLHHYR